MKQINKNTFIDVDLFEEYMLEPGTVSMDAGKLNMEIKRGNEAISAYEYWLDRMVRRDTNDQYSNVSKSSEMIDYLENKAPSGVLSMLGRTPGGKLSLSKKRVDLVSSVSSCPDALLLYSKYKSESSKFSLIKNIRDRNSELFTQRNGIRYYKIPYSVKRVTNRRFSYYDEPLINFNRGMKPAFIADEGYLLVWFDFKASDLRAIVALYLADEDLTNHINKYSDWYLGLSVYAYDKVGKTFSEEFFYDNRDEIKAICLGITYGKLGGVSPFMSEYFEIMKDFIVNRPRYIEFKRRIEEWINSGFHTIPVQSYFGKLLPKESVSYGNNSTLEQCLNAPTQAMTTEALMWVVNNMLEDFYDLGYTNDDIKFHMYRHDEALLQLRPGVLNDSWIFKNYSELSIDGIKFEMDFEFGRSYSVPEKVYMDRYQNSIETNASKIEKVDMSSASLDFIPIKGIYRLGASINTTPDGKSIFAFMDMIKNEKVIFVLQNIKEEDKRIVLGKLLILYTKTLDKDKWGTCFLSNKIFEEDIIADGIAVRAHKSIAGIEPLLLGTDYINAKYCKDKMLPCRINPENFNREQLGLFFDMNRSEELGKIIKELGINELQGYYK